MDPIKDAFLRIKQDILSLQEQLSYINEQLIDLKRTLAPQNPTDSSINQSNQQLNPTIQQTPTDNMPYYDLKPSISTISTGNEGVPTDRQADRQTDQQTNKAANSDTFSLENSKEFSPNYSKTDTISQIHRVSEVLESLDSIKKEIRSNFKHLTTQEMAVFSSVYTFEEQGFVVDYTLISQKLGLSESSIRDYIHKLIKKGIPILKSKENNKKVSLTISPELKKIASLQTILTLRSL